MSNSKYCCPHPKQHLESPLPPARPLAAIDSIFAAAILPEDHPDAPDFISERKPETDSAIIQSPSMTSKIKLQFRRKSVKNLKKVKEYDEDARQMTSQEVLEDIGSTPEPTGYEEVKPKSPESIITGATQHFEQLLISSTPIISDEMNQDNSTQDAMDSRTIPESDPSPHNGEEDNAPRLYKMEISQQLRSMSQMSSTASNSGDLPPFQPWTFHLRERSYLDGSNSRVRRVTPDPSSIAAIRAASSIYSRPVSADANEKDVQSAHGLAFDNLNDLNALFADWPAESLAEANSDDDAGEIGQSCGEAQERSRTPTPSWRSASIFKKTIKPRLSVLKLLRPSLRRSRPTRSMSSPVINVTCHDGPSDDPANYERNLSVIGDDRRRPSAVNIQRVKEVQEDDRRESVGLKKRLSRAAPLRDDASPLMAQALKKHQQEKALFRSTSKQRDSASFAKETDSAQVLSTTPFGRAGSSLPPPSLSDHNDLLDHLEKGQLIRPSGASHLLPPTGHTPRSSQRTSPAVSTRGPSIKTSVADPSLEELPQSKKSIGTSLDSWSRYPSHTRAERCGSAGRTDAVLTRDFAVDINPAEIHDSDDTEADSPAKASGRNSAPHRSKSALPKTRSMTFGGIVRYYSNLFHTRGWHGQNRRTSVTTGGRLEYPELEMLPPQMSHETTVSHKHADYLKRFEELVKEDANKVKHYLQEEEEKFEGYMKKEEKEIEGFVRTEEHKFDDFMKKEEGKLKEFVTEEEDKFKHHRHSSSGHNSHGKGSPFRTGSIFETTSHHDQEHPKRTETMIAPNDDIPKPTAAPAETDSALKLDGSGAMQDATRVASKAEIWSDLYKECLVRPVSGAIKDRSSSSAESTEIDDSARTMPPPALKPVKPRTPDKPKPLDPKATIRRFPSVTVIDDRKGHCRSISLVSVKTSRSTGLERSSTQDLVELVQAREREEREKLLKAIDTGEDI